MAEEPNKGNMDNSVGNIAKNFAGNMANQSKNNQAEGEEQGLESSSPVANAVKNAAKDTARQATQKAGKKVIKSIATKLLPIILPILGYIFLALLIVGVILLVVKLVISAITAFVSPKDIEAATTVTDDVKAAVSISEDGYNYVINEDYIQNIIDSLEEQYIDPEAIEFLEADTEDLEEDVEELQEEDTDDNSSDDELEFTNVKLNKAMITKYIKAEIRTMFPKIGSKKVDGLIHIYRDDGEEGTEAYELDYLPYAEFNELVNSNNPKAANYFSINPDTEKFYLCYATVNEVTTNGKTEYTVTSSEEDYQYVVEPYAMPSNFSISTHFIAQNKKFMKELVKLQREDHYINITLKDTVSRTTVETSYSGTATTEQTVEDTNSTETTTETVTVSVDNSNASDYIETQPAEVIYTERSTEMLVTEANTWIAYRENKIVKISPETTTR